MSGRGSIARSAGLAMLCALTALGGDDAWTRVVAGVPLSDAEIAVLLEYRIPDRPPRDRTNAYADSEHAQRLGRALFFDTGLSPEGVACSSCHDPSRSWADGRAVGSGAEAGRRNTPSLWNVAFNETYFWDGRSDALWAQALGPIESPSEMGSSRWIVAQRVIEDAELRALYGRAFGAASLDAAARGDPTALFVNCGKALAAFQRRIVSTRSKFDLFLDWLSESRSSTAEPPIDAAAIRGAKLFIGEANCRNCHSGPNFTNNSFHDVRVAYDPAHLDRGRLAGARLLEEAEFSALSCHSDGAPRTPLSREQQPRDWGAFKTPTLRNVARTAPYMHDGSMKTLERVLAHYSTFDGAAPADHHTEQTLLPLHLTTAETADLIAFLRSLTDESKLEEVIRR